VWLPEKYIYEMISRFKQIVQNELVDMLANVAYVRTLSSQSIANWSTGSHADDYEGVPGADGFTAETIGVTRRYPSTSPTLSPAP
jgi:hypothetical protein